MGGRDANGNVYCYRNCPVAYQAREKPKEPVQRFPLSIEVGKSGRQWFEVSLFAIPSYHPALSTVVHVIRPENRKPSTLERRLEKDAAPVAEPLWPMTTKEGQPVDLTSREKEILRCLAQGLSTSAIGKTLFISPVTGPQPHPEPPPQARRPHQARRGRVRLPPQPHLAVVNGD